MSLSPGERQAEAHRFPLGLAQPVALSGLREKVKRSFQGHLQAAWKNRLSENATWESLPDREPPAPTVLPVIF